MSPQSRLRLRSLLVGWVRITCFTRIAFRSSDHGGIGVWIFLVHFFFPLNESTKLCSFYELLLSMFFLRSPVPYVSASSECILLCVHYSEPHGLHVPAKLPSEKMLFPGFGVPCVSRSQALPSPIRMSKATFMTAMITQTMTAMAVTSQLFLILTPSAEESSPVKFLSVGTVM